ncbi:Calmodulin-binding protein 60 B [Vitis vinifera]|uniref:Calmodulin-binding protein 60 B n=1 Tax=Vitis vinifera TaxID=29760 RepID=A0A438D324_VITVI|nr:Calmodulin-binding protein 60 B [Vitis vinifera]
MSNSLQYRIPVLVLTILRPISLTTSSSKHLSSQDESSPKRIEGPDGRNLQLQFRSRLSLPLFTGGKVEGEQGAAIHIVLVDANSGSVVTSGPESSVKLDVVVLEGDFNNEDEEGWTQEEFDSHVVKEREGKRPLLTGDLQVTLKEGVGTLGDLTFTDNSSWIRSRKFRLGLKVALGFCEGIHIREAKTEAFTVKDHRGELYKKHYPPALTDDVWRLEKIGKDGSFHKRLNNSHIYTVEDFLRLVVRDSQKLRSILGSGMSNKMWEALIEHAKTCTMSGKFYVYYSDDTRNVGVIFNNIYELSGLIAGEQYFSADSLSESQKVGHIMMDNSLHHSPTDASTIPTHKYLLLVKCFYLQVYVDNLVKKAYENWNQVEEYDGKSLSFKQIIRSSTSRNEHMIGSMDYPTALEPLLPLPRPPVAGSSEQSLMDPGISVGGKHFWHKISLSVVLFQPERLLTTHMLFLLHLFPFSGSGYNDGLATRYTAQPQLVNSSSRAQFDGPSFPSHDQLVNNSHQTQSTRNDSSVGLALGPPQSSTMGFQALNSSMQHSNLNPFSDLLNNRDKGVDDYFTEEEIRLRSHEMLESDDMQQLLRVFSMGGHIIPDDGYGFPPYMASPSNCLYEEEDRSRSGKAVVGWLKIKAAMRWGFFIRKKAAEKRAQLIELEDD